MSFFTPDNLAARARGRWLRRPPGKTPLAGVGTDTRAELTDRAFIAITGDHHDGHDHLAEAVAAGARMLIVHAEPPAACDGAGVLLVDDQWFSGRR